MVYSVYHPEAERYDYYEVRAPYQPFAPTPRLPRGTSLGITAESAAWQLPPRAVLAGHGILPKGAIALDRSAGRMDLGAASDGTHLHSIGWALAGVAALALLWR